MDKKKKVEKNKEKYSYIEELEETKFKKLGKQEKILDKKLGGIFVLGQLSQAGRIENVTIELLGKGRELADKAGQRLCVVLIGEKKELSEAGKKLLHYSVNEIFLLTGSELGIYCCERYALVFAELLKKEQAEIVLIGGTSFGRDYAPRLSFLLDTDLITDGTDLSIMEEKNKGTREIEEIEVQKENNRAEGIKKMKGEESTEEEKEIEKGKEIKGIKNKEKLGMNGTKWRLQVIRPSFDGVMYSVFHYLNKGVQMVTVRPGVLGKAPYQEKASGRIQMVSMESLLHQEQGEQNQLREKMLKTAVVIEKIHTEGREYHLDQATMVVAGGRGMKNKEGFERLEEVALCLGKGAEVASTRPCVDMGWTIQAQQVGQTGITIKPELYLAFGISGAIQHITGFSEAKYIVGININPKAAIFRYCDVGVIGDGEKIAKALIQELRKREEYTK